MAGLQKTGYTKDTPNHYLIDSATIYKNLKYDPATGDFDGELLGATDGGVELDITNKYRDVTVDGTYIQPVLGNKMLSSSIATAKTSIKEFTAETLRLGLNGIAELADINSAPAGYTVITGKRYVEESDYIPNIAFVGRLSGSDDPVIAILDNCLVTTGDIIKTKDDDEAVFEVEFESHADYDTLVSDKFSYNIYFPQPRSLSDLPTTNVSVSGTPTVDKITFVWDAIPSAMGYVFRYGVQGETDGNRIYYSPTAKFDLTLDIFRGDNPSASMAGKTINVSVAGTHKSYVGVGTNPIDKAIDAGQNAMASEKNLTWSDVVQGTVPNA